MSEQDILNFKTEIKDFTLEELESKAAEIRAAVSKMILDSDLIMKAAIVDALIKEKKGE